MVTPRIFISHWNKGRTSIQGQALYVRSARQTARTIESPAVLRHFVPNNGLLPLRRYAAIPAYLSFGNGFDKPFPNAKSKNRTPYIDRLPIFGRRSFYLLDEHGERIRDEAGNYVFNAVPTTDWGSPDTLEHWRQAWADLCNQKFAEKELDCRIDHRSYERQGIDQLPTVHEGVTVRTMEAKDKVGRG